MCKRFNFCACAFEFFKKPVLRKPVTTLLFKLRPSDHLNLMKTSKSKSMLETSKSNFMLFMS